MAITTGKVRLSYCHVWQPQAPQNGQGEPKYSVTILIPKSDTQTLNAIYTEMESIKQQGVASKWNGVMPPVVKVPLYDGDGVRPSGEPFGAECRGHMVMTASSKTQPAVVDVNVQPIISQAELYSGCYARVSLNFFAYAQSGNKGLGCGLNGVQKVEDGEPLAGGVSAAEAFGGSNAYPGGAPAPSPQQQYAPQQTQYAPQQTQPQYAPASPQYAPQQTQQQYAPQQTQYVPQQTQPQYAPASPQYAPQQTQLQYTPQQTLDPITGMPVVGGVMGI